MPSKCGREPETYLESHLALHPPAKVGVGQPCSYDPKSSQELLAGCAEL